MHIPISTNYEDLIENALWIVVDAWAKQPNNDDADRIKHLQLIFLGHQEELMKTHCIKKIKLYN